VWVVASVVAGYVEYGVSQGLSRDALLSSCGLTAELLADPDGLVLAESVVRLWRALVSGLPGVVVPLALADCTVARLGILGRILRSAQGLRAALAVHTRYRTLLNDSMDLSLHEAPERCGVVLRHRPEVHALGAPIELMLATTARMLAAAFGPRLALREVSFAHARAYPLAAYEGYFSAPVRFDAAHDALWFGPDALSMVSAGSDPELLRYLEAHARNMLADLPRAEDATVRRLREALAQSLPAGEATEAQAARRLALSTRTLQRRLAACGTSFADVADEVRRAVAERLLRAPETPVLDVAFAAGYADAPSFYRAFKRWTGRTPQQWRAGR
jgi:AraC-like DNA-binding protein